MNQRSPMKYAAFFAAGLCASATFAVFLGELYTSTGGNELALLLACASWSAGMAGGTFLSRFAGDATGDRWLFPLVLAFGFLGASGFAGPLAIDIMPEYSHASWIFIAFATIFITPGLLSGFLMGTSFQSDKTPLDISASLCLGGGGGAVGAYAGAHLFGPFPAIAIANSLAGLLMLAAVFEQGTATFPRLRLTQVIACIAFVAFGPMLFLTAGDLNNITEFTDYMRYSELGYKIEDSYRTRYGMFIETFPTRYILNGDICAQSPQAGAEVATYLKAMVCLAESPDAKKVLIVGDGCPDLAVQLLRRTSVERVDCVQSDPNIAGKIEWHNMSGLDQRIVIIDAEARQFIRTSTDRYDLVIMRMPLPRTAQTNRYYTLEFFREVKSILSYTGVFFVFGPPDGSVMEPLMERSIYTTLSTVFENIFPVPQNLIDAPFFIAPVTPGLASADANHLSGRYRAMAINGPLIPQDEMAEKVFAQAIPLEPVMNASKTLQTNPGPVNTDAMPAHHRLHPTFGILERLRPMNAGMGLLALAVVLASIALAVAGVMIFGPTKADAVSTSGGLMDTLTSFTAGFGPAMLITIGAMGSHAYFGDIYRQGGVLIGTMLFGMTIGSRMPSKRWLSTAAQLSCAGFCAAIPVTMVKLSPTMSPSLAGLAYLAVAILAGILAGTMRRCEGERKGGIGTAFAGVACAMAGAFVMIPLSGAVIAGLAAALLCLGAAGLTAAERLKAKG